MNIGIVGSRDHPDLNSVRAYLDEWNWPPMPRIISGGARGVDAVAEQFAAARGFPMSIYLPDYEKHGRIAPLIRNLRIVEAAEILLAFWDGISKGTLHVSSAAATRGVPVELIEYGKN